jgi:hypothetical protein
LADLDSNQDKQNQNLLCYRYTIGQPEDPHRHIVRSQRAESAPRFNTFN